ncbi:uncharacterized protein LOC117123214, partial [Anneissia japonica]|uniref:uncharacterized protein LOC117123214 n=1 Tax=Anneissia japonica TaxID=1529436 RepID=UPI0014255837
NKVNWEIKKAKKKYYRYKVKQLETTNPRAWYKKVKKVCGQSKDSPRIVFENPSPETAINASAMINEHLTHICQELEPLKLDELSSFLPAESPPPQLLVSEVRQQLTKVQSSKAVPPGEIPPAIIKEFAPELAEPLTHIFNRSLSEGIVPKRWKQATVIPIPKKKGNVGLDQIRPISLTSLFVRILEHFVN